MSVGTEGSGPNPRTYSRADYAALEAECERLADALDRQSVITGDYIARCQRLADELAITRRVIDRIDQLCTTPHESKERFIRRVQSVIEWEAQAINGAKPLSAEALQ